MKGVLIAAATALFALVGCGIENEKASRTPPPEAIEEVFRQKFEAPFERYGWSDELRDCALDRVLPELDFEELAAGSSEAIEAEAVRAGREAGIYCVEEERVDFMDPEASQEQVETTLGFIETAMKRGFVSGGLSNAQAECAWRELTDLPHSEVIEVLNNIAAAEAARKLVVPCIA